MARPRTMTLLRAGTLLACFLALGTGRAFAVNVYVADFIPDSARTSFVGFEGLPDASDLSPLHVEDGVRVEQVGGQGDDIWSTYMYWGGEGSRSWYPNGGDYGYTKITRVDSSDFGDVGFLRGSGFGDLTLFLYYELWNDGSRVQADTLPHGQQARYLGFGGGGFDEIRLADAMRSISSLGGDLNALAIDSIELGRGAPPVVPEPGTLFLLGTGVAALAGLGRRPKT